MPLAYHISTEYDLFYLAGFGKTTGHDYMEMLGQAVEDPEWHPDFNSIVDMRAITEHIIDLGELRAMVQRDIGLVYEGILGKYKNAYIVRNEMDQSIGLLYDTLLTGSAPDTLVFESKVFYQLDPAIKWLGLCEVSEAIHGFAWELVQQLSRSPEE